MAALLTGGAVAATEIGRVWSRGSAELPLEAAAADSEAAARIAAAGAEALGQTVEVAVRGYQEGTTGENAMLNLLGSFTMSWAVVRLSTHAIRRRGRFGPFGDLVLGQHHIHHFVPGILIAFVAGGERMTQVPDTSDDPSCFVQQPPAWPPGNTSPFPHIGSADYSKP